MEEVNQTFSPRLTLLARGKGARCVHLSHTFIAAYNFLTAFHSDCNQANPQRLERKRCLARFEQGSATEGHSCVIGDVLQQQK
ncbi:MAG: hypothetical protein ACP5E5_14620 [Acidobacteriaceae bacterium]